MREIVKRGESKGAESTSQQRRSARTEGCWNAGETARATGQIPPLDRDRLDDEAESDGDHCEIRAGNAKSGNRESRRYRRDEQDGQRQCFPKAQAGLGREDSYSVGAKRQKPALAERYFAGEAEQHVQPDADQRGGRQSPH